MGSRTQFKDFNHMFIYWTGNYSVNVLKFLGVFMPNISWVLSDDDKEEDTLFDDSESNYRNKDLGTTEDDN